MHEQGQFPNETSQQPRECRGNLPRAAPHRPTSQKRYSTGMRLTSLALVAALSTPLLATSFASTAQACSCIDGTFVDYWPRKVLPANGRILVTWTGEHPVLGVPPSDRTNIDGRLSVLSKELRLRSSKGKVVSLQAVHAHLGTGKAQIYLKPQEGLGTKRGTLQLGEEYRLEGFDDSPTWKIVGDDTAVPMWVSAPRFDAQQCAQAYSDDGWTSCSQPYIPVRYQLTSPSSDNSEAMMLIRFRAAQGAASWLEPHAFTGSGGDFGAQGCDFSPLRPSSTPTEVAFTPISASGAVGKTRSVVLGSDAHIVERWSKTVHSCRPLTADEVSRATRCERDNAPTPADQ